MFVPVYYFQNYVDAHIIMGRLQEDGIDCWLKDENTVTINPILTNAVGGIKLMVKKSDAEKAIVLLKDYHFADQQSHPCPDCGSNNTELITSPRKASNWLFALFGYLFGGYAMHAEKTRHCFNCGKEFDSPVETEAID